MEASNVTPQVAAERLLCWRDVAVWLDVVALEHVRDAATSGYLGHVAQCVREEGERKYAESAGFSEALSA